MLESLAQGILTSHSRLDLMETNLCNATASAATNALNGSVEGLLKARSDLEKQIKSLWEFYKTLDEFRPFVEKELVQAAERGLIAADERLRETGEQLAQTVRDTITQSTTEPIFTLNSLADRFESGGISLETNLEVLRTQLDALNRRYEESVEVGSKKAAEHFQELSTSLEELARNTISETVKPPADSIIDAADRLLIQFDLLAEKTAELQVINSQLQGNVIDAAVKSINSTLNPAVDQLGERTVQLERINDRIEASVIDAAVASISNTVNPAIDEFQRLTSILDDRAEALRVISDAISVMEERISRDLPLALHHDLIRQMAPLLKGLETETQTTIWTSREILSAINSSTSGQVAFYKELATKLEEREQRLKSVLESLEASHNTKFGNLFGQVSSSHTELKSAAIEIDSRLEQLSKDLDKAQQALSGISDSNSNSLTDLVVTRTGRLSKDIEEGNQSLRLHIDGQTTLLDSRIEGSRSDILTQISDGQQKEVAFKKQLITSMQFKRALLVITAAGAVAARVMQIMEPRSLDLARIEGVLLVLVITIAGWPLGPKKV